MKHLFRILSIALMASAMVACTEETEPEQQSPVTPDPSGEAMGRAIVLNEGIWGGNNASLSLVDLDNGTATNDWFASVNGRGLGDVAQDMLLYGSKVYVSVWASNSIEVIDTASGTSTRIDMGSRAPRYIAADGGKLYVSCYSPHSVVRIDTATREIEATCVLGEFNPEGVAVEGGKLFVASSNVSDEQMNYSYDNKLYVVDLSSFANPTAIEVGSNPQKVMSLGNGKVLVNYWGDYAANPSGSAVVDAASLSVVQTNQPMNNMTVAGGKVYGYSNDYDENWNAVTNFFVMDANTLTVVPMQFAGVSGPYAIAVHPATGNIFIATDGNYSSNGTLYCFKTDGAGRLWSREMGMLPSKVVFL